MNPSSAIPFQTINWDAVEKVVHTVTAGATIEQTIQLPGIRIRMVQYPPGYVADHWCHKGHIVYCISGTVNCEMETGGMFTLTQGMCYVVSDNCSSHRSVTTGSVSLLIIDGDFLQ